MTSNIIRPPLITHAVSANDHFNAVHIYKQIQGLGYKRYTEEMQFINIANGVSFSYWRLHANSTRQVGKRSDDVPNIFLYFFFACAQVLSIVWV